MNYSTYENKIIDIMKTNKAKKIATLAELNATIEFDKNHLIVRVTEADLILKEK